MSKIQFKLNEAGVIAMLKMDGVAKEIDSITKTVQGNCGGAGAGYTADTQTGQKRMIGRVTAASESAKRDNEANNTLLKGLHR